MDEDPSAAVDTYQDQAAGQEQLDRERAELELQLAESAAAAEKQAELVKETEKLAVVDVNEVD